MAKPCVDDEALLLVLLKLSGQLGYLHNAGRDIFSWVKFLCGHLQLFGKRYVDSDQLHVGIRHSRIAYKEGRRLNDAAGLESSFFLELTNRGLFRRLALADQSCGELYNIAIYGRPELLNDDRRRGECT